MSNFCVLSKLNLNDGENNQGIENEKPILFLKRDISIRRGMSSLSVLLKSDVNGEKNKENEKSTFSPNSTASPRKCLDGFKINLTSIEVPSNEEPANTPTKIQVELVKNKGILISSVSPEKEEISQFSCSNQSDGEKNWKWSSF